MTGKLTFIGGGNMATSIIGGLVSQGMDPANIWAADRSDTQLQKLKQQFGINTGQDNRLCAQATDTLVLAIKPDVMKTVCCELADVLHPQTLVISIAAGVRAKDIAHGLAQPLAVVRCMPNTPALLGHGASGLYANQHCSEQQREAAEQLLGTVGTTQWVPAEADIDSVTALSGSGPAYFFYLIENMVESAVAMGLTPEVAENLAIETAYGAAAMARQRDTSPAQLRKNVTSKGGTTAAALGSFADADFPTIVAKAMQAAQQRAQVMGDELGNENSSA